MNGNHEKAQSERTATTKKRFKQKETTFDVIEVSTHILLYLVGFLENYFLSIKIEWLFGHSSP